MRYRPSIVTGLLLALSTLPLACAPSGVEVIEEDVGEDGDEVAGNLKLRFDLATLDCAPSLGGVCPPEDDKCLCEPMFDALNYDSSRHFLAVGTEQHRDEILAAGNAQAVYVDDLNTGYPSVTGSERADQMMAKAAQNFPTVIPKWIFINEISAGRWPDQPEYRRWVIDLAKRLGGKHGRSVIIAAPFATPGANDASWSELAKHAYIGAEVYLTGADINKSGNSVAWCKARYLESINAYAGRGVPLSRLMLVEHFGNTPKGTKWGRAGVSDAGWHNAIEARSKAADSLGFAGFLSYSWAGNKMSESQATRIDYIDTYAQQKLP